MRSFLRFFLNGLLPLVVLSVAGYAAYRLLVTPPTAKKSTTPTPAPVVDVIDLAPKSERVFVEAYGTVAPAKEVVLRSEVGGRIIEQHPSLAPGGLLKEGEILIRIDPAEYEIAARKAEAELVQAQSTCDLEQGQQTIARREWGLLEDRLTEVAANQSLALREPQLLQCEAKRDAAQTALDKAKLDLDRTTVRVPFDSMVIEESVEKGLLVDRQNQLATLVGADEFWVQVAVPLEHLSRIAFPDAEGSEGSAVSVILKTGRQDPIVRTGRVLRLMADLTPEGRMARVLVSIRDPLNLTGEAGAKEGRILIGSYVRLKIDAGQIDNVYPIPRAALRENSQIWVKTPQETLQIRNVEVLWGRDNDVLVADGIRPGDMLITTRLANVIPEMKIRVAGKEPVASEGQERTTGEPLEGISKIGNKG